MGFTVSSDRGQDFTQISDTFILTYMPAANGNYVKIYLYLQLLCQHPGNFYNKMTVNNLADEMECTENDIMRAFRYWKKQGLIDWTEIDGEIQQIRMLSPVKPESITGSDSPAPAQLAQEETAAAAPEESDKYPVPEKQNYTPLQAEALRNDIEIDKAIRQVEELLGEPLSPAHLQLILYFMCDIGFSADLLATLYETALHKGKKKTSYIEAIGIDWARQGIRTPQEAKAEASAFSGRYSLVTRTLGIRDALAPVHQQIIDSWDDYHFDDAIIEEACKRGALQAGGGTKCLRYVSKILKKWSDQNVHSLEDIEKCDETFKHQKRNTAQKTSGKNQFQNFPQRVYSAKEYSSLEQRLLQKS